MYDLPLQQMNSKWEKIEPIRPSNLVLLLATRYLYWGLGLTGCQPDLKNNP